MKQITSADFKKAVSLDPAWASKLTEPVEITDHCDMARSNISHLSPLLHFTGRDGSGDVASFAKCKNLKVAQGTFHGYINFSDSGVEEIDVENLIITRTDNYRIAAGFSGCKNLRVAQGNFPGEVNFSDSGIEKIDPDKLILTRPNKNGNSNTVCFIQCAKLKIAQGTFHGKVDFSFSGIEKIGKLEFEILDIQGCYHLKSCPATYISNDSIKMDDELRTRLTHEQKARDLFRQHKQEPIPEI